MMEMKSETPTKPVLAPTGVTLDVLLLLLVMPAHARELDAFLSVMALLAYLIVSLWRPFGAGGAAEQDSMGNRLAFMLRYALLLMMAAGIVIVPTLTNVLERITTPVEADGYSPAYLLLSDSAMQTELALAYLADGLNPYAERYADTPLRFYQWQEVEDEAWEDPAYEYFVYLPANLFLSFPFYAGATQTGLPYDQRLVFLLAYLILLLVLPHLSESPVYKLSMVAGVGLNPLLTDTVILGMNDAPVLLALALMIILLLRGRLLGAALFLGIACAFKQYAWFIVPFFLFYLWQERGGRLTWRQIALTGALLASPLILTMIPFFLWNAQAIYTDTFAFPAGQAALLYPVRGFTIGRLLMGMGVIPSFTAPFPFQLLQALFGIPLLLGLLRYQRGRQVGAMMLAAAVFIFGIGFVSRFFHQNYVGVVTGLATIGVLLEFAGRADES